MRFFGYSTTKKIYSLYVRSSGASSMFSAAALVWAAAYSHQAQGSSLYGGLILLLFALIAVGYSIWRSGGARHLQPEPSSIKSLWVALSVVSFLYVLGSASCSDADANLCGVPLLLFLISIGVIAYKEVKKDDGSLLTKIFDVSCRRSFFWLAVGMHVVGALVAILWYKGSHIDVFTFQQDCAKALLHGVNPYTITHQNIYTTEDVARNYAPGIVYDGVVHWGYPYPPSTLLFAIPGFLLGDVRYSQVAAVVLSAFLLAGLRRNRVSKIAALVILLNPMSIWVEMHSWVEPFVLLALTATIYAAECKRWWLPVALGVFLSSKQYVLVGVPLFWIIAAPYAWRERVKLGVKTCLAALLVTAPLALWNFHEFIKGTIFNLSGQPPRLDSLSWIAVFPIPAIAMLIIVLGALGFCLLSAKHSPGMFAACFGFVLLAWMSVNKQAFVNYYMLISQAFLLAAVAMSKDSVKRPAELSSRPEYTTV